MPSFSLMLFLLGVNGMYFLPLLIPSSRYEGSSLGTYRYHILARVLVLLGAFLEAKANGFWLLKRHPHWTACGLVALGAMTVLSIIDGAEYYFIIQNSFGFYWLILASAVVLRPQNVPWILLTLVTHALVGVPYVIYTVFVLGITSRTELLMENNKYQFLVQCVYMGFPLFMLLPAIRARWIKIIAVCSFSSMIILALIAASRATILLAPVGILLLGYSFRKTSGISATFVRWIVKPMAAFAMLYLVARMLSGSNFAENTENMFKDAGDGLMKRLLAKGDFVTTMQKDERWYEIAAAINSMSSINWLIGKGFYASWTDSASMYDQKRRGIHNSYVNCFYWGGAPLFLFFVMPLVWTFKVVLRSRDPVSLGCACFMLIVYLKCPGYTVYLDNVEWLVFCLACGPCGWSEALITQEAGSPNRYARSSIANVKPSRATMT
jgi:hypothetical protein